MSELFETIPKLHHPREVDDYKENIYTTIRAVGDEQFMTKMNENTTPINKI